MVKRSTNTEIQSQSLEEIMRRLLLARTQRNVRLRFKDGRELDGAVTFIERLGVGRLINVEREFALEFNIYDLKQVVDP